MKKEPILKVFSSSHNSHVYGVNCIRSVASQTYSPVEHFYIDDQSEDDTLNHIRKNFELLKGMVGERYNLHITATTKRKFKLLNLYEYVIECDPEDVICVLDGDDWLASDDVLEKIAKEYEDPDVGYVYTNWKYSHNEESGISRKIPGPEWDPYAGEWLTSAMSTFRVKEFLKVPIENFLRWDYKWFSMGVDQAYALPIIRQIRLRDGDYRNVRFINEPLYVYQFLENPNKPRDERTRDMTMDAARSVSFIRDRGYLR